MENVKPLNRYVKASELRAALVALIAPANATATNRKWIERNQNALMALEPELRRFGILNPRQKWYGTAVNVLPTLEKTLNSLGYATKVVRRERAGRQVKEIQFHLNPAFDLDGQTKLIRAKQLADEIQSHMDKADQKLIVLRQIFNL